MPLSNDIQLNYVDSTEKASELMRWLGERRSVLGLDIETGAPDGQHLNPYYPGAKTRLIQVGDMTAGWAIPELWFGVALEALTKWDGKIALHNAAFDTQWLRRAYNWEVPWDRIVDTMLCAKILRPGENAALKYLACQFVDPYADSGQQALNKTFKDNKWDWYTIPTDHPSYWIYSALDPVLTAHVYEKFPADKLIPEAFELETEILRITSEMTYNGSRVDLDYARKKRDELIEFADKSEDWAQENWGVNINASAQMAKLFQSVGATFSTFTPKGAPSVSKAQLEEFEESGNEVVAQIAQFIQKSKRARKFASAYFDNFVTMSDTEGFLHPSINQSEAITGRMSVSNPALQQLPSKDPLVRDAFVPRHDGEVIVTCDYNQVETRLLASFTGDPGLVQAFWDSDAEGSDFFSNLGKIVYDDPTFTKKDTRRALVKTVVYASLYGASAKKMAQSAKMPLHQFQPIADQIFRSFPGIKSFQNETIEEALRFHKETGNRPCITLPDGRVISTDPGHEYKLSNYKIQGTAAIVLKKSLIRLDNAGLLEYLMLPVHDEIVASVPKEDAEDVRKTMRDVMRDDSFESVPLTADAEGPFDRWGEKYR